ncbi:right-handed parallel beta-helix repeat-containing protein [Candidatus Daviesbacteria bacterium]|nr:right-handed parallel beta-helix repeat-containing protein [Candidatus Daviesbacteria bacterium]
MVTQKGFVHILLVLFLLISIAASVYLVQQKTNLLPKAGSLKPTGPETSFSLVGPSDCSGLLCIFKFQKEFPVDAEFKVEVLVRSDIDEANLFKAKITFPAELVEIVSISTEKSFIQNWAENFYDNNQGVISLAGGVPSPGFKTEQGKDSALMATITFKTKKTGKGTLSLTDDSVIYRNTDNINILTVKRPLEVTVSEKTPCSDKLQDKIDAAPSGSTLVLNQNCIYRETVTINKPLILDGSGTTQIRGSDIWTDWNQQGAQWISTQTVPGFYTHGLCRSESNGRCLWAEQVFVDSQPLEQVSSSAAPSPSQFKIDASRKIILGSDPNGHTVEVTTRKYWVLPEADNVVIKNFTMKHSAVDAQDGAIKNNKRSNITIENNILSDVHGAVVSFLDSATGLKLINNDISRGGQLGVGANANDGNNANTDIFLQGNKIHHNNTEEFDWLWEAGGVKMAAIEAGIWDNNELYSNNGPGLWCDIGCNKVTISNNSSYNNRIGIFYEISRFGKITGNKVWKNYNKGGGWGYDTGIILSTPQNTEVFNNIVAWNNNDQITVVSQHARQETAARDWLTNPFYAVSRSNNPHDNYIHDNKLFGVDGGKHAFGLGWLQDWTGVLFNPESNNRGANNQYYYENSEDSSANNGRFGWGGSSYKSLAAFNQTPGEENGRYLTKAEKDEILAANNMPSCPECPDPIRPTPTPVPLPTPTVVPTPIPANKGDGNYDGRINLEDMSVLLTDFNKEQGYREPIDMNDDKKINTFDFSLHRKLLLELGVIK